MFLEHLWWVIRKLLGGRFVKAVVRPKTNQLLLYSTFTISLILTDILTKLQQICGSTQLVYGGNGEINIFIKLYTNNYIVNHIIFLAEFVFHYNHDNSGIRLKNLQGFEL